MAGLALGGLLVLLAPPPRAVGQAASPVKEGVCAACHRPDAKGRQEVIDSLRTTPDGWRRIISRMERMHKVALEDDEREAIVKELSDRLSLTPQEYREFQGEVAAAGLAALPPTAPGQAPFPAAMERTCTGCHNFDIFAAQRRTPEAWMRLRDLHLGTWPNMYMIFRDVPWDKTSAEAARSLAKRYPLEGPASKGWKGPAGEPSLAGEYVTTGSWPGRGAYTGTISLQGSGPALDYTERLVFDDGTAVEGSGQASVFAGYLVELRGTRGEEKTLGTFYRPAPNAPLEGKWKAGVGQYLRMAETWAPAAGPRRVVHAAPAALVAPGPAATVSLTLSSGASDVKAGDVTVDDPAVKVSKVTPGEGGRVAVELSLPENPKPGYRKIRVKGAEGEASLALAPRVDLLEIRPDLAIAHLGGGQPPPVAVQFEARGRSTGPDGKPWTADDVDLGLVQPAWRMDEYNSTNWDDDAKWVGKLDEKGLFTPSDAEINLKRKRRINTGDVWVAATLRPEGAKHQLRARVLLRVAVPDFREDL